MAFLRHLDLFPAAAEPQRAEPESGVHRTTKKRKKPAARAAGERVRACDLAAKAKRDDALIPLLNASPKEVRACTEDARARWVAPFIDGVSTLERVLASSALAEEDARAGMQILIDAKLVALT